MKALIAEIKKYALENYENGYDTIVECYEDEELEQYCKDYNITTLEEFKKSYAPVIDHRRDIEATAF